MITMRRACAFRHFVNVFKNTRDKSTATHFAKHLEHQKKPVQNAPFASTLTLNMQKEAERFMLVYPDVVRDITNFNDPSLQQYELGDAEEHFKRVLDYNAPHGKKTRGLTVVIAYKEMMANESLTPEKIRQAHILGWCVQIIHSALLMYDDVLDSGEIRRGKPCWYKLGDTKEIAFNDFLMMEKGCYNLLKLHFGDLPCYKTMIELLHETQLSAIIGQTLEYKMINIAEFTLKRYRNMAKCKTAYFTSYTPIALPMMLAGYNDEKLFGVVKEISLDIGYFFQVQNDYLDYFDDSALQKPGTDIEHGKPTWLTASTMELGNDQQKEIMKKCYGKKDPECIDNVKRVYDDLDFPEKFARFKEQSYENIKQQIKQSVHLDQPLQNVLLNSLNQAYDQI